MPDRNKPEEKEEPKEVIASRPKPVMLSVAILADKGGTALIEVETNGVGQRYYVPSSQLVGRKIAKDDLQQATPYGVSWQDIINPADLGKRVANEFHRINIWTLEDLELNQQKAHIALMRAQECTVRGIMRRTKEMLNHAS